MEREQNGKEYSFVRDGEKYTFKINVEDSTNYVAVLTNEKTKDKIELIYDDGIAEETGYEYKGKNILGIKKYKKVSEDITDYTKFIDEYKNSQVQAQGYGTTTKLTAWLYTDSKGKKHNYRYQIGKSGKDKGYTKISCACSYRLKNSATGYLDKFEDNVLDSNSSFAKSGISVSVAAAILAVFVLCPEAGIGVAVTALVSDAGSAYYVIDSYNYFKKAQKNFDKAKAYGKKI